MLLTHQNKSLEFYLVILFHLYWESCTHIIELSLLHVFLSFNNKNITKIASTFNNTKFIHVAVHGLSSFKLTSLHIKMTLIKCYTDLVSAKICSIWFHWNNFFSLIVPTLIHWSNFLFSYSQNFLYLERIVVIISIKVLEKVCFIFAKSSNLWFIQSLITPDSYRVFFHHVNRLLLQLPLLSSRPEF